MTAKRLSVSCDKNLPRFLPPDSNQYFFGYNKWGNPKGRLIVLDENRPHLAREYSFNKTCIRYNCLGCGSQTWLTAYFTNEATLKVPNDNLHSNECVLRTLKEIQTQQDRYTKMFGFKKRDLQIEKENKAVLDKNVEKLEVDLSPPDQDISPPTKKNHIDVASFYFSSPSSFWLRRAVERLKLPYFPAALLKWAEIDIDVVSAKATVKETLDLTELNNTGFRSLALLLLGDDKLFSLIRAASVALFFNKLTINTSNAAQRATELNFMSSSDISDNVFHLLSTILDCRIGVFTDTELRTFGIMNGTAETSERVTILLKESDGVFVPIKALDYQN